MHKHHKHHEHNLILSEEIINLKLQIGTRGSKKLSLALSHTANI